MIGLLVITHGTLGESLIQCANHVLNKKLPQVVQIGVTAGDDPALLLPQARNLVKEVDSGDGVLILTDIYGGTPSNMAAKLVVPGDVEAVAGVSLPMLIRVLNYRDCDLKTIVTKAISGGCEGVLRVPVFGLHNAATER